MPMTVQPPRGETSCSVVLAYRDKAHEEVGRPHAARLMRRLGINGCGRITEWRFEMFGSSTLRALAADQVEDAKLVLIATKVEESLPSNVREWIDEWSARSRVNGRALVTVLTRDSDQPVVTWPDYFFLDAKARLCQMEFATYVQSAPPAALRLFTPPASREVIPAVGCVPCGVGET